MPIASDSEGQREPRTSVEQVGQCGVLVRLVLRDKAAAAKGLLGPNPHPT